MAASFVLPLYPLEGRVLFPGQELHVQTPTDSVRAALDQAGGFGGAVVASLTDGESVHEVAVTALVSQSEDGELFLRGSSRCRLLALVSDELSLVRAERLPDPPAGDGRTDRLERLLQARYSRLCHTLGRPFAPPPPGSGLSELTWSVTADLTLTADQQQGFLNVPDAVTRGRLLLVAVREIERRERFLRPWAHLRNGMTWN